MFQLCNLSIGIPIFLGRRHSFIAVIASVVFALGGHDVSAAALKPEVAVLDASLTETKKSLVNNGDVLTREQWLEDLASLDGHIRHDHINPFWRNNEAGYLELFYEAQHYINETPQIDSIMVNGYFEKIVAYLADGHNYLVNKSARFGLLPYSVDWFGDDLYIVNIDKKYQSLLGAQIIGFDEVTMTQANALLAPFVPAANASGFKLQAKDAYHFLGLLFSAGISKRADEVTLHLQLLNGKIIKQSFNVIKNLKEIREFVDLHELGRNRVPFYRQEREKNQWFTFMESEGVLYVRYAFVVEKNPGDIKTLTQLLVQFIDAHRVKKMIVDVRNNTGGDSYFNASLINIIARNKTINQRGKLFVLTNYSTFSAAINFVGNMEIKTRALFIGEKVGDNTSFVGEAGPQAMHSLPNSHIVVSLSFSEWNATYDNDKRDAPALDIFVTPTIHDVLAGRDPVLQAALDYDIKAQNPIGATDESHTGWMGRYDYSADKALNIFSQDGKLQMEITELAFSHLYSVNNNECKTDMTGIHLKRLQNGDIELIQKGSTNRILHKLADNDLKPLELLMAGRFEEAKITYRRIYEANPQLLSLRANSLGILATHIRARYGSQTLFDQLHDIAVSLHGLPLISWDDNE